MREAFPGAIINFMGATSVDGKFQNSLNMRRPTLPLATEDLTTAHPAPLIQHTPDAP